MLIQQPQFGRWVVFGNPGRALVPHLLLSWLCQRRNIWFCWPPTIGSSRPLRIKPCRLLNILCGQPVNFTYHSNGGFSCFDESFFSSMVRRQTTKSCNKMSPKFFPLSRRFLPARWAAKMGVTVGKILSITGIRHLTTFGDGKIEVCPGRR